MLAADTADLLDLLPPPADDPGPPPLDLWSLGVHDLLDHAAGDRLDPAERAAVSELLSGHALGSGTGAALEGGPTVAARAAAAALGLLPWPDRAEVLLTLADPIAAAAATDALRDQVVLAAAGGAVAAGRGDIAWLLAHVPRPLALPRTLTAVMSAEPTADQRVAVAVDGLREGLDPTTALLAARSAAELLGRVPAVTAGPELVDALVELLVLARRRGPRTVVDAAVGLLARVHRTPGPLRMPATGTTGSDRPTVADAGTTVAAAARQRQAQIDGLRTAVALLAELQSYPPGERDPRAVWTDLAAVARCHGVTPVGVLGEVTAYDPRCHELLTDLDDADDPDDPADGDELAGAAVRVTRSGYTWVHGGEVVVLQRALVRVADAG